MSWTGSRGWGSGSSQQPWSATGAATWAATWSGSTWGANNENTTSSKTQLGIGSEWAAVFAMVFVFIVADTFTVTKTGYDFHQTGCQYLNACVSARTN